MRVSRQAYFDSDRLLTCSAKKRKPRLYKQPWPLWNTTTWNKKQQMCRTGKRDDNSADRYSVFFTKMPKSLKPGFFKADFLVKSPNFYGLHFPPMRTLRVVCEKPRIIPDGFGRGKRSCDADAPDRPMGMHCTCCTEETNPSPGSDPRKKTTN